MVRRKRKRRSSRRSCSLLRSGQSHSPFRSSLYWLCPDLDTSAFNGWPLFNFDSKLKPRVQRFLFCLAKCRRLSVGKNDAICLSWFFACRPYGFVEGRSKSCGIGPTGTFLYPFASEHRRNTAWIRSNFCIKNLCTQRLAVLCADYGNLCSSCTSTSCGCMARAWLYSSYFTAAACSRTAVTVPIE